jgi:potassium-transporting ATPase KdpC subunit
MKEFTRCLLIFIVMSLIAGLAYPLIVTGIGHLEFRGKAGGSLVVSGGKTVGSSLVGQEFKGPAYFHGRPSALEKPYDAGNSGGSNFGPTNAKYLEEVGKRVQKIRKENGLEQTVPVPADLVLASSSGLDPHISQEAAMIQVRRVAKARGLRETDLRAIVQKRTEEPLLGFLGERRVNVLSLNLAIDGMQ